MDSSTFRRTAPLWCGAVLLLTQPGNAQTGCSNFGSAPVAASIESSPIRLGCAAEPTWPTWHLFTPAHRQPGPHVGFDPGNAIPLPRVLVAWYCTGFLLLPVVPLHVRTIGYVIDQPEHACAPPPT